MKDNLIIVPATKNYFVELDVLLKSLQKHMPHVPVHIMTRDGEANEYKDKFDIVEEVIDEPKCDSEFRQVRTSRFRYAAEQKDNFKSVCILDADMLCVRDFTQIFRMADTGTIVACSNNTLYRYVKKDFDKMHIDVPEGIEVIHASFSSVPIFISPGIHYEYLMAIWNNKTGNDLDVNNLLVHALGLADKVYLLGSENFTNIHHTMLKPEIFVRTTTDGYYNQLGEKIYMFHGHWLDDNYVKQLLEPMQKHYGWHKPYIDIAKNCINAIKKEYEKYV